MTYTFRKIDDTYVVWLAPANRYMQLQAPAFYVLQDWAHKLPKSHIIRNCAIEFKLQLDEAQRFVMEVVGQLQSLISSYTDPQIVDKGIISFSQPDPTWQVTKYYYIGGEGFRFRYEDAELEDQFHPGFAYLEQGTMEEESGHCFDFFKRGAQAVLRTQGGYSWCGHRSNPGAFIGRVFLQLLNCLYHCTDGYWMGAVHASAVSGGQGAVLLTAPSGSGKSTLAALLKDRGYRVLADDFTPLSLQQPQVYPFPKAISVKNGSVKALQTAFPTLRPMGNGRTARAGEVFLPLDKAQQPAPVKAIVFLQYNPQVEFSLEPISGLGAMDRFLRQLWLAPTIEAASRFMDWYFEIPCYEMQYSDSEKAISSMADLLK